MEIISRRGILLGASSLGIVGGLPAVAKQGSPVRGGTIVASMDLQPKSLDPIMGDAPTSDRYALIQMFEGLLKFDVQGNLQPSLATKWDWSEDKKSIVFKLREGVVFHDGEPFNAEAAVFNIARVVAPGSTAPRSPDLADIAEGKGAAAENVVPLGTATKPKLATIPLSDGVDADLAGDDLPEAAEEGHDPDAGTADEDHEHEQAAE